MFRRERNLLLAVDDEADFLELIEQIGKGVGCTVITADSAASFREQLSQRQPALILLDLQMPGMDGIEALRYLARQNVTSGILLASGMDQRVLASARQLGESLGLKMLGTLQKPAMLEDIETLLAKHLEPSSRISVEELRTAIDEHELIVHYQPKVVRSANDWHVRSAEALVRWRHPRLGLLYPGEFLPLAEQSGLIVDLTDFVLTDAIRQIGHWGTRGLDLGAAVNLSPRLVQDLEFPERLSRVLREFESAPRAAHVGSDGSGVGRRSGIGDGHLHAVAREGRRSVARRLRYRHVVADAALQDAVQRSEDRRLADLGDRAEQGGGDRGARHRRAGAQPVAHGVRRRYRELAGVRVPGADAAATLCRATSSRRRCRRRRSNRSSTCGTARTTRSSRSFGK